MGSPVPSEKRWHPRFSGRILSAFAIFTVAATVTVPNFSTHAATNPFLTLEQIGSNDIEAFTKWTSVMPRYTSQHKTADAACYGEDCLNKQWEEMLTELRGKTAKEQLEAINEFFNAVPYISDQENYGVTDYWQTPYELMEKGGDCEDYAIAKYISLRRLGIPQQDMRILVVHDSNLNGIIHAVLEVTMADGSYILDNQEDDVRLASDIDHYQPVFAINESKWWAFR